jgi:Matrixin
MDHPTSHHPLAVLSLVSLVVVLLPAAMTMPAAANGTAAVDVRPGEVIRMNGISLVVPGPGRGVWGAALDARGQWRSFGVQTALDGSIRINPGAAANEPPASPSQAGPQGRSDPCTDSAYTLYSTKWSGRYLWYFNVSSTPTEITQDDATSAVRAAATNITHAENDCGLPDNVSATATYRGSTTKSPNIGVSTCSSSDGTNVVGFGDLASSDLGFTCWWTFGGSTTEADVKYNKTDYDWIVNIGGDCHSKYSVEAVATHEFGHVFGLGHVSESLHPSLTMSPVIAACQSSETTLGLGDVRGLEAKY